MIYKNNNNNNNNTKNSSGDPEKNHFSLKGSVLIQGFNPVVLNGNFKHIPETKV